jgi:hypothetical protein
MVRARRGVAICAALSALLSTACLENVSLDPAGFRCDRHTDCGTTGRCVLGLCSRSDPQPAFPIRMAFYYAWYPQLWTVNGITPYAQQQPRSGYYDSADLEVIRSHLTSMEYGKIEAGIYTWYGSGTKSDALFTVVLRETGDRMFRWALHYGNEFDLDPPSTQIAEDLSYIRERYGKDPSYLRIDGRFVVFVHGDSNSDACEVADRWTQANTADAYLILRVGVGYTGCASQPDDWHHYSPPQESVAEGGHSFAISPGFWRVGEPPRLARDLARWKKNVQQMVNSGARFHLITSFNRWSDGTAVENAFEWDSTSGYGLYLDALRTDGQ